MTELTPSQIGQIRTRLRWILSEAMIADENASVLGHPNADDRQYLGLIKVELYNVECAAKQTRNEIKRIIASLEQSE